HYGPDEQIAYSDAQVILTHGKQTVFTKSLPFSSDRELAGFDYQFPNRNANYTLAIHYTNSGNELAATTVPLTVGSGDPSGTLMSIGIAVGATVLLLAGVFG